MFTGIIGEVGAVRGLRRHAGDLVLDIATSWADLEPGESVAVDGACLTVTEHEAGHFAAQVVATSLERTAFGRYRVGRRVNLERALRVGDRLGGHLVQGHVDGVGQVTGVVQRDDGRLLDIAVPPDVLGVSMPLGSVTVDGVSLTIQALSGGNRIQVSLIPFTLQHTTLGERAPGDVVHLEGDVIGKYLRQFVRPGRGAMP